ncbi:ORF63 [macacine gammaherpesvirus 12]|uniref:ORF63 n=1 Tax=macacine gammaherpesvirus 12 TaxID=2560571 RepID=A0A0B5CYH3_9GAMA|nr:ORF63 [Macaca nemestrina rhadinovirus 2]AJE29719.1 ORF63 [Macaca nemestrina rhadinovirus 2]
MALLPENQMGNGWENGGGLEELTDNLLACTGSLQQLKLLMEFQLKPLPTANLLSMSTVTRFLNTAVKIDNPLAPFIQKHSVFFLMRVARLSEPISTNGQNAATATGVLSEIVNVLDRAIQRPNDPQASKDGDYIGNRAILTMIAEYIHHVTSHAPSGIPPTPPMGIGHLPCIEQIVHETHRQYWKLAIPESLFIDANSVASPLQTWLILSYCQKLQLTSPPLFPTADELARQLVTGHHELFVPLSTALETYLTMPLSKQRAFEIYSVFAKSKNIVEGTPLLAFTDEALTTFTPELLFLYDFVIEALCKNQTYGCSRNAIEHFIRKGVDFMAELGAFIEKTCGYRSSVSLSNVREVNTRLASCGLSKQACKDFRAMILMTPHETTPNWENFTDFLEMVNQLTLYGFYFYECIDQYSPTSIALSSIQNIINRVDAEQSDRALWRTPLIRSFPFPWKLNNVLAFFKPSTPKAMLQKIYDAIPSYLMRSLFEIAANKAWGNVALAESATLSDIQGTEPHHGPVSPQAIAKYCSRLQVSATDYDAAIVSSPGFAAEFIRTKLYPILSEVLRSTSKKNRSLFQIRWLIVFAAEDAKDLAPVRRSLALAYFQIMDILEERHSPESFYNLLDYLHETLRCIRQIIPDATCPQEFLQYLFTFQNLPIAASFIQTSRTFISDLENGIPGILDLISLGAAFYNMKLMYDSTSDTVEVPTEEGQPLVISMFVFKSTIRILEKLLQEAVIALTQTSEPMYAAHIRLMQHITYVQKIAGHEVMTAQLPSVFHEIHEGYLQCFKRFQRLMLHVTGSCCYSLTRYFGFLYQPPLISNAIVEKILNFNDKTDTTDDILKSLSQPVGQGPIPVDREGGDRLSKTDVELLHNIYSDFQNVSTKNNPTSIKLEYSGNYDETQVSVDWNTYGQVTYLAPDETLKFTPVNTEALHRMFAE